MEECKKLVWTRSVQDWASDALILRDYLPNALPNILHLPCIELQPLPLANVADLQIKEDHDSVCLFTSPHAVKLAAQNPQLALLMQRSQNFCVGAKTLKQLIKLGFTGTHPSSVHHASSLGDFIKSQINPVGTQIFALGGVLRACDLKEELKGFDCHEVQLYQTLIKLKHSHGPGFTEDEKSSFINGFSGIVCFFSPSAVKAFAEAFAPRENRLFSAITSVAIGGTTRQACNAHFEKVLMPPECSVEGVAAFIKNLYPSKE